MEKLEETSMSDDAIIHQQLHMNMQNRSDALGEDEIDGNTGETKKPTDAVEDRHISMSTRSRMMKRQNTDVAFHAYTSGTPCFQNHEVYIFNVEELDLGNGYNTRDGIYVVPFSGYYVFTWTVGAYNNNWYRTDIVIDGATSTWITTQDETAATGIVVKHVSAGDHVFIRRHSGSYCGVHDEFNLSSFSGWKIF
ncbi:uncharacterized protein LOC128558121 [Mercenaria mercenaria]|uniref:uncharacterized protein LOC128558121 n=1 Tax=Mercenaria mercenaria TaxID=6596 RepID=UPI00234E8F26|nr:uncharacterized protein LOC128558121 [Mercenaria mercenaria]